MMTRRLGRSDLEVAPLAFGGNVFGWTADEPTSFKLLDAFVAGGGNLIDTANSYSRWVPGNRGGESETIIGNWLSQRPGMRARVLIATKVGSQMGPGEAGLSKRYIIAELERSLLRLKTEYVDLYQSHRDDADTAVEETLEAYAQLVRAGKVRVIGASNFSAARLRDALRVSAARDFPRYESLQPEYNLYARAGFESELAGLCREQQIGVIPYFALASGFLTGKYRSSADFGKSPRGESMRAMLDERGRRILGALDKVGRECGATAAQVSLAWLLARGVTAPIASATNLEQLDELLRGVRLQLPAHAVQELNEASAAPAVPQT